MQGQLLFLQLVTVHEYLVVIAKVSWEQRLHHNQTKRARRSPINRVLDGWPRFVSHDPGPAVTNGSISDVVVGIWVDRIHLCLKVHDIGKDIITTTRDRVTGPKCRRIEAIEETPDDVVEHWITGSRGLDLCWPLSRVEVIPDGEDHPAAEPI